MMEKEIEKTKNEKMSQKERLELAAKLDKELDEFINSLPKKTYQDGWPEDRWEEEMEKHPFFMTKTPEPGAELHPLYEGLQKLKYDPEENEPEELALSYKEDGNFNFKYQNYRLAVLSYTEGIKIKCGNPDVEAMLYNNRSAAHFFLKNYRSSLKDCEIALKIQPKHKKCLMRAANCLFHCEKFNAALTYCNLILDDDETCEFAKDLKKICQERIKVQRKLDKQTARNERKKAMEAENLFLHIFYRDLNIDGDKGDLSFKRLEPCFPQLVDHLVHLDEEKHLIWPVVFVYPEYKIMDFIQEFHELQTFEDQLMHVFSMSPEWDKEQRYSANTLNIYFETPNKKIRTVQLGETLDMVLKSKEYVIKNGTPSFILLVRNSEAENKFLENY